MNDKNKMDISNMKRLKNVTSDKFLEMLDRAELLTRAVQSLYSTIDGQVLRNQLVDLIEHHYDLGKVVEAYEVFGGYTNRSFAVICEKDDSRKNYFIRKYKINALDQDVILEHKLLNYVHTQGLKEAAGVIANRNGTTFVKIKEIVNKQTMNRIFAVYDYLGGRDDYTWTHNENTPKELISLGHLLAKIHNCAKDFDPGSLEKKEPKIQDLFPDFKRIFQTLAERSLDSRPHEFFNLSLPKLSKIIDKHIISDEDYAQMFYVPIHGDYHAGNVKFLNEEAIGVFDFDWSKVDVRLFDICLGLAYCCSSWHMVTDGHIRLDDCRRFLEGYNNSLGQKPGDLPPLNEIERKNFPKMMLIASMYLVYWCTDLWYYLDPDGINDYESLYYLVHIIHMVNWVDHNQDNLAALVA